MLPLPCILELVWVLESVYAFARDEIVEALLTLVRMKNVSTDFVAIEAGIKVYSAGGDFADGVIAAAGISLIGSVTADQNKWLHRNPRLVDGINIGAGLTFIAAGLSAVTIGNG
jgi:predicted nucleic-acid-binding protein